MSQLPFQEDSEFVLRMAELIEISELRSLVLRCLLAYMQKLEHEMMREPIKVIIDCKLISKVQALTLLEGDWGIVLDSLRVLGHLSY